MTGFRLATGGRIDRDRPVSFCWNGRRLEGLAGDTLASALLASGERIVGRSFKLHRPRGVFAAGVEEPNAYVTVGSGARRTPNLKATGVELCAEMEARAQNCWPDVQFDIGAATGLLSPFLPAGFYYKTFMGPFRGTRFWMLCEAFIRRAAGMGRASAEPDPARYERADAFCDLLVVGAGPAGLAAAEAAASEGADVILAEQDFALGGSLLHRRGQIDGQESERWLAGRLTALRESGQVRVLPRTQVFGLYDGGVAGMVERPPHGVAGGEPVRRRFWVVHADRTLLATGAMERGFAFENNDLPGVMLASALETYAVRYAVACGRRILLATNNDSAYGVAEALSVAGLQVTLADCRREGPEEGGTAFEILRGFQLLRAEGRRGVRGAVLASSQGGATRRVECDVIGVSGGWNPVVHLACHRGARPEWDESAAAFLPPGGTAGLGFAGAVTGCWQMDAAAASGRRLGLDAARELGSKATAPAAPPAAFGWQHPLQPLWEVGGGEGGGKRSFVDLQNDVTAADIRLSVREGYGESEHLKRYTTMGMSPDQGKTSNVVGLGILSAVRGVSVPECGTTGFRPPYDPVEIGALAGRSRGPQFRPVRRMPGHAWSYRNAAVMTDAGLWRRPWYFPSPGEGLAEASFREAKAVRATVGMTEVSSLGKIAVQGPDAAAFLDHVYVNRMSTLAVGRARYGVMLRDDGLVLDDGTVWRMQIHDWFVTTTTAEADRVRSFLEGLLATRFGDLRVHLTSVTDHWAGVAVAGPRAREALAGMLTGIDVGPEGLPFMGVREGGLAVRGGSVPCRVARISFSGELGYEIYVGADHAESALDALQAAVLAAGGVLYGLEALGTMRVEKGHVTAAEIDGRVTLRDLGLERMASAEKPCVGQALASRPDLLDDARPRLAGFRPVRPTDELTAGALLAEVGGGGGDLGWITAVARSPALGGWIGIGFVRGGAPSSGRRVLQAVDAVRDRKVQVETVPPCFFDPEGGRLHG